MRLRITALLLTFAGAANCLRMAAKRRPHNTKSRIVRVTGGKASVLYSDGARQWTIDGSRLKHFELDDLRKRDFDKLDDGTLLFSPEAGLTGEPSFLFSFTPGAKLLYAVAADRARGDVSTGECSSFSHVLFPPAGVLVHAHGTCARYKGRTAQVVRLVNAEFAKLHEALTAAESEVGL